MKARIDTCKQDLAVKRGPKVVKIGIDVYSTKTDFCLGRGDQHEELGV